MSTYQVLTLMISFATLIVLILTLAFTFSQTKK